MNHDFTRSKGRINPSKTMTKLLKMRSVVGADTRVGHRISNLDEIRQNKLKASSPAQLAHLEASEARQIRDLELSRK